MKSKLALVARFLIPVLFAAFFSVPHTQASQESGGPAPGTVAGSQSLQVTLPAAGGQETLRVYEGRSLVVNTPEVLKRVAVTNEQIATAVVVSPHQVIVHGIKAGNITLLLWDEMEQMRSFNLQVQLDLEPLRATLARVFPGQDIQVSQSGSSALLTGNVISQAVADQAALIAKSEVPGVVSLLAPPPLNQVIMLEVKFAEVQRNAFQQLGLNIFSTGATNTIGTVSTQQFAPPGLTDVGSGFKLTDLLNIFVFRPDLNLGVMIKALQQKALLETLAEPNLLALSGKEASFLAGGEFPIPVIQGTSGTPTVSVQFKEFGVRLKFIADPNPDGTIRLHVAPEVSSLDYANAVTVSGFLIPALSTRRAETDVQLRDGQSFAIAGLLDNRITETASKIPWLGDVPLLGKLFQSRDFRKSNSELLVMVTPRLVKPLAAGQAPPLPEFPIPFIKSDKPEGKAGEVPPVKK